MGRHARAGLERKRVSVAHRRRCHRQLVQSIAEPWIGGRLLMRAHRARPRRLRLLHRSPRPALGTLGLGSGLLSWHLAHAAVLSHPTTGARRASPINALLAMKPPGRQHPQTGTHGWLVVASRFGTRGSR
jgi:hypothetical protein